MRQHLTAGALAAVIGAAASAGVVNMTPPKVEHHTEVISLNTSKHAWPSLNDAQQAALARELAFLKDAKVTVLCDGADCRDLQTDVDNALEDAGADSTRDRPVHPLGYGIAVVVQQPLAGAPDERGQRVVQAFRAATGLELAVMSQRDVPGIMIAIGKKPR